MTRKISREKYLSIISESVAEQVIPSPVSATETGAEQEASLPSAPPVNPSIIVESPTINVSHPEVTVTPEITVQPANIAVQPPDMQPIADAITAMQSAITESISAIPAPNIMVEPYQPVPINLSPFADAMLKVAEAINGKPDHGEAIKGLLQQIADKPQTATWTFNITRDNHGNIENIQAVKTT